MNQKKIQLRLFDNKKPENISKLWLKMREAQWLFDDSFKDDVFAFAEMFMSEGTLAMEVGDFQGIVYGVGIKDGGQAMTVIHLWDEAARGPEGIRLVQGAALAAMRAKDLHKLSAMVAVPNAVAHKAVKRVGFKEEGTIREQLCYNGKWTDVVYYGLLRAELEELYLKRELDGASGTVDRTGTLSTGSLGSVGRERQPISPTGDTPTATPDIQRESGPDPEGTGRA